MAIEFDVATFNASDGMQINGGHFAPLGIETMEDAIAHIVHVHRRNNPVVIGNQVFETEPRGVGFANEPLSVIECITLRAA